MFLWQPHFVLCITQATTTHIYKQECPIHASLFILLNIDFPSIERVRSCGNTSDFYFGGARFGSLPGNRIPLLVSASRASQMMDSTSIRQRKCSSIPFPIYYSPKIILLKAQYSLRYWVAEQTDFSINWLSLMGLTCRLGEWLNVVLQWTWKPPFPDYRQAH
jgi:hypothetical protein